jgi:hypothetical protein
MRTKDHGTRCKARDGSARTHSGHDVGFSNPYVYLTPPTSHIAASSPNFTDPLRVPLARALSTKRIRRLG